MSADFWIGLGLAAGIFLGLILHEFAHALAAVSMGDKTPIAYGRLTLNPKAHADPIGTLILPALFIIPVMVGARIGGFLFGFAKPVPFNPQNMRSPRWGPIATALAGPATNLVLAFAAGAGLSMPGTLRSLPLLGILGGILIINVYLAIINSLPIPPLDGSKVLRLFLSPQAAFKLEELSQYFLLFLLVLFLFFGRVIAAMADPVCRVTSFGVLPGCVS